MLNLTRELRKSIEDSQGYRECWRKPWRLDTQEKLDWANTFRLPHERWKLGDFCWYKPLARRKK
jgi:hypothetical protein